MHRMAGRTENIRRTVLVVEDELVNSQLLGFILSEEYNVLYAEDGRKALEVLQICPLERILVETDSPYLSPVPMRGKRNDPGNLPWICAKIAEVKRLSTEEVARITAENGCRLFGCP